MRDIKLKLGKIFASDLMQDLRKLNLVLDDQLESGIEIMLYRSEIKRLMLEIFNKAAKTDKKEFTLTLKPPAAYVLYTIIQLQPDNFFTSNIFIIREIIADIDQVAVSFKPLKSIP